MTQSNAYSLYLCIWIYGAQRNRPAVFIRSHKALHGNGAHAVISSADTPWGCVWSPVYQHGGNGSCLLSKWWWQHEAHRSAKLAAQSPHPRVAWLPGPACTQYSQHYIILASNYKASRHFISDNFLLLLLQPENVPSRGWSRSQSLSKWCTKKCLCPPDWTLHHKQDRQHQHWSFTHVSGWIIIIIGMFEYSWCHTWFGRDNVSERRDFKRGFVHISVLFQQHNETVCLVARL